MARVTALLPEVKKHFEDLKNYAGGEWREPTATEWLEDPNPEPRCRQPMALRPPANRRVFKLNLVLTRNVVRKRDYLYCGRPIYCCENQRPWPRSKALAGATSAERCSRSR